MTAFLDSVAIQTISMDDQLTKATAMQSPSAVFGQYAELNSSIGKAAQQILFEPTSLQGQMDVLFVELPAALAGAIGERLLVLLKKGESREEVVASMIKIGERTVRVYTASAFPIRRMRCAFPFLLLLLLPESVQSDVDRHDSHLCVRQAGRSFR